MHAWMYKPILSRLENSHRCLSHIVTIPFFKPRATSVESGLVALDVMTAVCGQTVSGFRSNSTH